MNRTITITATALLTTITLAAPANAWPRQAPMSQEQATARTELCAGNPPAGPCSDTRLTDRARATVFAYSADNASVERICSAHTLYTHTWRMGFCRNHIYVAAGTTTSNVAHDWSVDGVISRAALLHGVVPG